MYWQATHTHTYIYIHYSLYIYKYIKKGLFIVALWCHGPLARYVKFRVAHAPGMPGTFSPPPLVSDPDMHHGTGVTHVPWCMSGSLTSGFIWSRWQGKRSRHSRRMRNPKFHVSGKRPIWHHRTWSTLVPLPKPMLINHQCGLASFNWGQFRKKASRYLSLLWFWKLLI